MTYTYKVMNKKNLTNCEKQQFFDISIWTFYLMTKNKSKWNTFYTTYIAYMKLFHEINISQL